MQDTLSQNFGGVAAFAAFPIPPPLPNMAVFVILIGYDIICYLLHCRLVTPSNTRNQSH